MNMRQRRRAMIAQMDRFHPLTSPWMNRILQCDPSKRRFWDMTMPRWKAGERRNARKQCGSAR